MEAVRIALFWVFAVVFAAYGEVLDYDRMPKKPLEATVETNTNGVKRVARKARKRPAEARKPEKRPLDEVKENLRRHEVAQKAAKLRFKRGVK